MMEDIIIARGLTYLICCVVTFWAFKRFIYSILDPFLLFLLVIPSGIAFSIGTDLMWYVIIASIAFWLGMFIATPQPITRYINKQYKPTTCNLSLLKVFTYFFCFISLISSVYTFMQLGIPILSDNPSESKVAGFEGLGILRRLQFIGNIAPIGLLVICASSPFKKDRRRSFFLILFLMGMSVLSGSKSSILNYIMLFYLVFMVSPIGLDYYKRNKSIIKRVLVIGSVLAVGVLAFIVSVEAVREGGQFLYSFLYRLMEFGEVMIYYTDSTVQVFCARTYPYTRFFYDEFNEVLGMLRLVPYNIPIGYNMVTEYWNGLENDVITGPNTVFFVKGHIYFGFLGGMIYSFILGIIFARIRAWFFKFRITDLFKYTIATFIFFNLTTFLRESAMFIGELFSLFVFGFPIYFTSHLLVNYKKQTDA